jgi:hypothetical protein
LAPRIPSTVDIAKLAGRVTAVVGVQFAAFVQLDAQLT